MIRVVALVLLDRDELDAGSDPRDATSTPGGPAFTSIPATKLELRDRAGNPAKRKMAFTSKTTVPSPARGDDRARRRGLERWRLDVHLPRERRRPDHQGRRRERPRHGPRWARRARRPQLPLP